MRITPFIGTVGLLTALNGSIVTAQTFPSQPSAAPPSQQAQPQRPETANGEPVKPAAAQPAPPNVVAKVNDQVITQVELEANVRPHLQKNPQLDQQTEQKLKKQVLEALIDGRLVEEEMMEKGPKVAPEEVKATIDRVKNQTQAQGVSYKQFLAERGQTEKSMEKRIEGSLAWQKFQQQEVTEPKLREYYAQNQQHFGGQDYAEVRQQVVQSYVAGLWTAIADKVRPDAKIEVVNPPEGNGPVGHPPAPANGPVRPGSQQ